MLTYMSKWKAELIVELLNKNKSLEKNMPKMPKAIKKLASPWAIFPSIFHANCSSSIQR